MNHEDQLQPTTFGYELLRDHVIPAILGKHEDDILYWVGKEIARSFPLFALHELPDFFKEAHWGELTRVDEKRETYIYTLVRPDEQSFEKSSFQLEAGFLAAQHETLLRYVTECHGEKNKKQQLIRFEVKWDESAHI